MRSSYSHWSTAADRDRPAEGGFIVTNSFNSDPVFETHPRQIANLIGKLHEGSLALPDFQRDFVWEPARVAALLQSVMSRFPAGNLLFWRQGGSNSSFASRPVEGAPTSNGTPTELVLDGQQRLTAIYQAQTGQGDQVFYIHLNELVNDAHQDVREATTVDWEKAIAWCDVGSKLEDKVNSQDWQFENIAYPIKISNFDQWLDRFAESKAPDDFDSREQVKNLYRRVRDQFISVLGTYSFPVTTLPEDTAVAAVCTVFETLNRTGKPLGPFELLTARFYPEGINLRDLWVEAQLEYPLLGEFDVDPYSILQAVCLRSHGSAQRSDVLGRLTAQNVRDHWDKVTSGAASILGHLKSECGVISRKYLPYTMILVPMAAIHHEISLLNGLERGHALSRLRRYFWCTAFTANYDQGANSQAGADYGRLKDWLFDETKLAPEALELPISLAEIHSATVRRKALHAAVMALTICDGAKDFHDQGSLTYEKLQLNKVESHHIFPKAYLNEIGSNISSELILNRALIDAQTNKIIGRKAPSTYISTMEEEYGSENLMQVLRSHLIPNDLLRTNDYEGFLASRLASIGDRIAEVTERPVDDHDE
jgi:hypothetical protein